MMKKKLISGFVCGLMLFLAVAQPVRGAAPRYGIAIQSLIDLRLAPSYAGEMGTQALMGTPLHILGSERGWLEVMTPEGYISWTTTSSVQLVDEKGMKAWNKAPKLIVTEYFTLLHKEASATSAVVSDVVWGDLVKNMGEQDDYYKVQLPDGRMAFLKKESGEPFDQWLASRRPTAENIIATAKMFLGFPYVWGGASTKGVDCSGFTKTSFFLNGVVLRRDASQQATTGDPVDISKGYANLKPGDLLFFGGKKVTHVGMYIGNGEFIHSAGMVHISSLRPEASNYDAWNAKRLLSARRILTQIDKDPGIVSLKNHPYYK